MAFVVPKQESLQYDGTNGAYICTEWIAGASVRSDDGSVLEIQVNESDYEIVPAGSWVIRNGAHGFVGKLSDAAYTANFVELS